MTGRILFALMAILLAILCCLPYEGSLLCWPRALAAAALISLWGLWRSIIKPSATVSNGLELLSAQDYNNRLAPVGQRDADRIASLFNSLMDKLHDERLRLHERDKLLSQLIEASPMGIAMMNFDGIITDANSSFRSITGMTGNSDIIGRKLSDINSPLTRFITTIPPGENRIFRRGDAHIYRCYNLWFMESGFRRPFILVESLTEEMMQAEREAYGKVIRLISHEVNNTLGGISTLLEILADIHADNPDMAQSIASVNTRCHDLTHFIGAYADVVKLPDPDLHRISLRAFISRNIPFLESMTRRRIDMRVISNSNPGDSSSSFESGINRSDPLPDIVNADEAMLGQALLNIVKNASESMDAVADTGPIIITVRKSPTREMMLEIIDSGGGISEEVASRLFNPFFSTKPGGRGIGLTLVAEILRRHNCRFLLQTEADGLTNFRITFPIH